MREVSKYEREGDNKREKIGVTIKFSSPIEFA